MSCFAQLNMKIGYQLSYSELEVANRYMNAFDQNTDDLQNPFGDLHLWQGFELGLRYKWSYFALEGSVRRKLNRKNATFLNSSGVEQAYRLFYSITTYALGGELLFGRFGLGGSLDFDTFSTKARLGNEDKRQLIRENDLNTTLHISYYFKKRYDSVLQFCLRPYVHLPLRAIDFGPIGTELNVADLGSSRGRYLNFGISLIFMNGY